MKNNTILVLIILIVIIWLLYNQKKENFLVTQKPITFTQCAWIYELNDHTMSLVNEIDEIDGIEHVWYIHNNTDHLIVTTTPIGTYFANILQPNGWTHPVINDWLNEIGVFK